MLNSSLALLLSNPALLLDPDMPTTLQKVINMTYSTWNNISLNNFRLKDLGKLRYFLGIEVAPSKDGLVISQRKYGLDILEEIDLLNDAMIRIVKYIKSAPGKGLIYEDRGHAQIVGYLDVDWAGSPCGNLISLKSKKQNVVARSNVEVEYRIESGDIITRFVNSSDQLADVFTKSLRGPTIAIYFIRFLRRTEGVEAARKYFLDARKSPSCTYHVYIAYATMAFCLDKDPKMAHNVFEAGLKRFMHEPVYILEYADFLIRLNDDQNIRALFERALSSLPPEESVEVWKKFTQFEQTYGDLASMLKVEQRKKEALSGAEEGTAAFESSLQDIVSRYSFMDLWPCSSNDLDHLARQEWLAKNINKKMEKSALPNGTTLLDKTSSISTVSTKLVYPDTSKMMIYDPKHTLPGGGTNAFDEILKATPPALVAFLANLPAVEGPTPNVDIVLSICLQSDLPIGQSVKTGIPTQVQSGKAGIPSQLPAGPAPATSELSGSSKSHPVPSGVSLKPTSNRQYGKRKEPDRQEDDDTTTVQSQPLPRDAFRIRQYQKARASSASQTGSVSYGSAFSGDLSGSTDLLYVQETQLPNEELNFQYHDFTIKETGVCWDKFNFDGINFKLLHKYILKI
ncbi:Cleavage stimulation factor subunit 77, partial [Mucuna pruriens]